MKESIENKENLFRESSAGGTIDYDYDYDYEHEHDGGGQKRSARKSQELGFRCVCPALRCNIGKRSPGTLLFLPR
jgi:hypothetical protein